MIDLLHAWRHLFSAVVLLATGSGPVTERLKLAYFENLLHISPNPQLPKELQQEFSALLVELRAAYPDCEGPGSIDNIRAARLAKRVVSLYEGVTKKL